jgi:hypothetical protein
MASWKRQKGHQQEVGCVPRQNSRKRLHEIGRESFCHGSSRLLAVRSKPQYPRMLQSATAISGQKPTADLLLTFPSDIRVDKVLQPTTSLQYVRALGRAWQRCWEARAFTRDGAPTHERVDVHRPGNGTPKQAPGGIAPGWQTEHDEAEFRDLVATADRLRVNLADFNALHFGPSSLRRLQSARKYAGRKRRRQSASAPESAVALHFGWYNFASYLSTLTIQWLPLRPPQAQPRQLLSAAHQPANIP